MEHYPGKPAVSHSFLTLVETLADLSAVQDLLNDLACPLLEDLARL